MIIPEDKILIQFNSKEAFDRELEVGSILVNKHICFVPSEKFMYIRGTYWHCPYSKDEIDTKISGLNTLIDNINSVLDSKVDKVYGKDLSSNDFTNEYKELLSKVSKPLNYKGSVATRDDLPTNALEGDVYNVISTNVNFAWTGTEWDPFGTSAVNIVNDLTTGGINAALSAEQGKSLKGMVDSKPDIGSDLGTAFDGNKGAHLENVSTSIPNDLVFSVNAPTATADLVNINYSRKSKASGNLEFTVITDVAHPINKASSTLAGVMSAADKIKLDGLSNYNDTEVRGLIDACYTKEEADNLLANKVNTSDLTTVEETTAESISDHESRISTLETNAPNMDNYYTKTDADGKFATITSLDSKVNVEAGKSLISDMDIEKLSLIEPKAQVNKIEGIKVNGTGVEISSTDKSINIDLSDYVTRSEYDALVARIEALEQPQP